MQVAMEAVAVPWWVWPIALFAVSFAIGIVAVLAGVGGGVLFVPIVGSLFPFHLDFVRGAGLMFALAGTLAAGPPLLRAGMASVRLVLPLALVGSVGSFAGALVGFALAPELLQTLLERIAARQLTEHDAVGAPADVFGAHDLVGVARLQHAVLVDARGVGEGIGADHRLVRLHHEAGDL